MSRRRKVGVAALKKTTKEEYKRKGEEISELEVGKLEEQLLTFKEKLESFAQKHKKDINRDPVLRAHFQSMCTSIGVDPLASNKGFWAEILGVGDFYYELGVLVVEICLRTREANGGLMPIGDMVAELQRRRPSQNVSQDDVERAIKQLKVLGSGFGLVKIGKEKLIRSVPMELSTDHIAVLSLADTTGFVTKSMITEKLGWDAPRVEAVIAVLMKESIAWVDHQYDGEPAFWFASMHNVELQGVFG
eukprot:TRINITY_DN5044_c0_g1_i1.p1 TRINITY_DN5044_c0_g1~~TRINITY_DN5044_c0_g1_i1.p1  ORF type:complete len:247 (+),score=99.39 TRINITY_DN5044_c0_g1_i1:151-891(+)